MFPEYANSIGQFIHPNKRTNKAVYTTAPVADGWAGAVMIWAGAVMVWAGAVMIWTGAVMIWAGAC